MPADSNRVAMRFVEDSVFGQFRTDAPTMTNLRFTGESLSQATQSTTSQEIRSDRQIVDLIRTGVTATGDINGELSFGSPPDEFLEATLGSAGFSTQQQVTGNTFAVSAGAGEYTITDSANSFGSFVVGQWVYISGFAAGVNNGFAKISSVTADAITVTHNGNGANENEGAAVTITMAPQITNGTTLTTFNLEKEFTDLSGPGRFEQFAGMGVDQFSLNVTADGIITWTISFVGAISQSSSTTLGNGNPIAAPTEGVMNAVDNVQAVLEGGGVAAAKYDTTQFSLTVANNLRARLQVGTLGAVSLGTGTINVTGGHTAFYETNTVMAKYLGDAQSGVTYIFTKDGNALVVELPTVKYSSGTRSAGGINQDVLNDMQYQAFRNATEDTTIRIAKFTDVVV